MHIYTLLRGPSKDTFPTFWIKECPEVWRHLEGGVSNTKVSGESQEVIPVSPGTALSIHSGSSGLSVCGRATPSVHSAVSSRRSVRAPSVYSFVGSGVPSHGQADAGLNDCNGAASASSVPLRVKGPSSSASLVTPSVPTQVSRSEPVTPSVHSLVARSVVTPSVHSYRRPPEPSECHTPSVYSVVPASGAGAAPASGVPAGSGVSVTTPSVYSLCPGDVPDGPPAVSSCCPGFASAHESGSCRPGDAPLKRMRVKGPCSEAFHVARCVSPCALSQFRSVASAITTNEVNHDDAVPLFRPDVAPYPRQKTVAKPEPPAGQLDIQAEQSWVCPLCEVEVYQEPGLRARELFRRKRWNHLLTRHTAEERRAVPKLGAVSQVAAPSALIPPAQRAWSCPFANVT